MAANNTALHSDSVVDVATASNYKDFTVTHFHLELDVSFDSKSINAKATLDIVISKDCNEVNLDTHTLKIRQITQKPSGKSLEFEIKPFAKYGSILNIPLKCKAGETFQLEIQYTVTHDAPGIDWLAPAQTVGKKLPYMYTQGQAVLNRSFFPCIDTPAVKSTYSATVKVPDGFTAVMSADEWEKGDQPNVFKFNMTIPIPAYLVAMAVGDLVSAEIGPRSRVWTEPALLEAARAEFDEVVEEYIKTAEKLFGPYVWGRYDILVLPPCFPYGGMENPCLTFVTPTLIVGDKSLTTVVMHELAHSWFGNLVTNATWSDFWLNEGFTMYAQRRICMEVNGEAYTCLEAATRRASFRRHLDSSGEDHPLNKLRVAIDPGVDPDDTYNETPYEKGYCFCSYLKNEVGTFEDFDRFLRAYVDKFKYKSIVSEDFFDFFLEYFPDLKAKDLANRDGFEFHKQWLHTAGWPPYVPDLSAADSLIKPAERLAAVWAGENVEGKEDISRDVSDWPTYQVLHFLDALLAKSKLPDGTIEKVIEAYPHIVNDSNNTEFWFRWSLIVLENDYQEHFDKVRAFLGSQGKQKITLPVYQAMKSGSEAAQQLALDVYATTKEQLHVTVRNYVKKILFP
ncbi:aminopeptidase B-like [Ptychodera flava]|uniref:aminopeptidase B-like n=1 Tax=Ptychodera flava TaxID=63121 RepID=UPI00396A7DB0